MSKKVYILCGLPCSGKSTYLEKRGAARENIISSDYHIDVIVRKQGKTYDEVFKDNMKIADKFAKADFELCLSLGRDPIFVDRTNMGKKARAYWIQIARSKNYECVCVVFEQPSTLADYEEMRRRNSERAKNGKTISNFIVNDMIKRYEEPTLDEGFVLIEKFNWWGLT